MATKTATIIIDVQDKSLVELNQEIKALETSMQGLKTGTKEWIQANQKLGTLKGQFGQATQEARKLQGVVQELGSAERIRAVAKLGAGMVGAFSAASGAAKLLGGNAKQWDEMTAKAATLMSIMGGLNQVSELFSKQSLMGLKSIGQGFGTLVRTVRTASTGMKIALISTGIGALVVAVGLLIANFDKLKNLVSGKNKKDKKDAEDNLKLAEGQQKVEEERQKQTKNRIETNSELLSQEQKAAQNSKLSLESKKAELKTAEAQAKVLQVEYDQLSKIGRRLSDAEAAKLKEQRMVIAINAEQQKTLTTEIKLLEYESQRLDLLAAITDSQKKYNDSLAESENKLIVLNSQLFKSEEIYQQEVKILDTKLAAAWDRITQSIAGASLEELKMVDTLEAQKKALVNQNEIRKFQLGIDITLLQHEIQRNKLIDEFNQGVYEYGVNMSLELQREKDRNDVLKNNNELIALDLQGMADGRKIRDDIVNFDLQRNKILKNRLVDLYPSELKVTEKIYGQIKRFLAVYSKDVGYETLQFFADKVKELTDSYKTNLVLQAGLNKGYEQQTKYGKQLINDAAQELALKRIASDFAVKSLDEQLDAAKNQAIIAGNLASDYSKQWDLLSKQQDVIKASIQPLKEKLALDDLAIANGTKRIINDEEHYKLLQDLNKLANDYNAVQQELNSVNDSQNAVTQQALELGKQVNDLTYQQAEAVASVGIAQTEVANQLEDQLRLSAQLQQFTEKYAEEIQVVGQIVGQSMELMAVRFAEKAKKAQRELDKLQKQQDELAEDDEKHQDKLQQYEEELKDANGDRYDTLLGLIAQENAAIDENKAKKDQIALDLAAKDKERQKALHKQAVWEKANALIQAIINTALGVIKALPNIFLAIATGVLGAVGIGVIAAQKIPPENTMAKGGVSKGGLTMVGEEGFELAQLPPGTRVYNHVDSMKMLAGGVNLRQGMAGGGIVGDTMATPALGEPGQSMIDYDRLINGIIKGVQALPNPQVQVQKITQAQQEVSVTKELAGLTR